MSGSLTYAYAVVRPSATLEAEALAGMPGVAGGPVGLVRSGDLAAAVGEVPAEEFSEVGLRRRLEDLDWLEVTARAHHAVVEALAAHTTVLPLRLATVYLDRTRVAGMLTERAETFAALLDRLADHEEWGVKVYAEPPPPDTGAAGPGGSGPGGAGATGNEAAGNGAAGAADAPGAGRAYLRRRRHQRRSREESWAAAEEAVRRIEAHVRDLAPQRARHRVQQGGTAEGGGENVANDAYLVPRGAVDEFRQRVRQATDGLPGVRVDVTGPWAPYSFATPPTAQQGVRQR
ncbi:GvpL/GvpF family gas vesicle protein [Streptomyces pactum]|uniref:GvpL/GvpF family gas vesicle protein n=1 Tax=Streptomyces pactum TaxID=68249 RepID=A0ABS0NSE3_9ACTN|nr:GvpL/GvpF family gas vesicle protein [Streptomyces pactum]MBH5338129.1 GvpL/GvpF family gas vesicle protein [Streptomyces pactum]